MLSKFKWVTALIIATVLYVGGLEAKASAYYYHNEDGTIQDEWGGRGLFNSLKDLTTNFNYSSGENRSSIIVDRTQTVNGTTYRESYQEYTIDFTVKSMSQDSFSAEWFYYAEADDPVNDGGLYFAPHQVILSRDREVQVGDRIRAHFIKDPDNIEDYFVWASIISINVE